MKIQYSNNCPDWVKKHITAAQILYGKNPVGIAKALKSLTAVNPAVLGHDAKQGLFESHGMAVYSGLFADDTEALSPWLSVSQGDQVLCYLSTEA